ncbi:MAG: HigA family addiction module antidote protein [Gemmatimonadetes bacterium]|nr:HigA family addiction module antidote protein [Gemmatimonadota bacterium]
MLEERNWTQAQLADRLGVSRKHVSELVTGKAAISEANAIKLARVLGSTVGFWLKCEACYRSALADLNTI